ncbi:hypothetical protein ID47_11020 [Candidatus Paracaedibacter acanthamoebae]|uniref:Uncharacterized protein n=1 Tax=Candidatus Odyssella acanthamoebae TaxID=91604 RepID=A0A077AX34_9PROT|nr:hypothetical protein ID47_11020 [Candidatus Paracaedibacter acanthamoebae]
MFCAGSSSAVSPCNNFCTAPKACTSAIIKNQCLTKCTETLNFDLYCKLKEKGVKKKTAKRISIYTQADDKQNSEQAIDFLVEIDNLHNAVNVNHLNQFFSNFSEKQTPLKAIANYLENSKEKALKFITQLPDSSQSSEPTKSRKKTIISSIFSKERSSSQSEYKIK